MNEVTQAQVPKAWLIYVDRDGSGDAEEWNVFYTPCEVWLDEDLAIKREAFLNANKPEGWAVHKTDAPLHKDAAEVTVPHPEDWSKLYG